MERNLSRISRLIVFLSFFQSSSVTVAVEDASTVIDQNYLKPEFCTVLTIFRARNFLHD